MKIQSVIIAALLVACNNNEPTSDPIKVDTPTVIPVKNKTAKDTIARPSLPVLKKYANKRFKEVTVEKTGDHKFLIRGLGQIFEANFNWIVEDGHEELKKGFQMTDAGAPAWGKFEFTIEVAKKRANSTLTLILFESSAMDGSRQHELPIVLY